MKTGLILFIFLLVVFSGVSQNLVSNSGFELLSSPVSGQAQLLLAAPWQIPGASLGNADLYNAAYTGPVTSPCDNVDVPQNTGGNANPYSGNGYAGISVDPLSNFYEYITIQLDIPLDAGQIYILDFFALRADSSRYALNRMGALLTTALPVQGGSGIIPFTPQFEYPALISDSLNWTHLQFAPYSAAGGEKYLTIGFFRNSGDPAFTIQDRSAKNSGCTSFDNSAYYYIDEVTLIPDNVLFYIPDDSICICPYNYTRVLEAVSNVVVTWTNSNGDSIGTGPTLQIPENQSLIFSPGDEYTYYAYGSTLLDSIKVVVMDIPVVDLGQDTTICEGDSVRLNALIDNAILYTWSTGDSSVPVIYVKDTGTYWVVADNCGCPAIDTITLHTMLPSPPIDIGEDSIYCFFNYDSLKINATTSDALSYLWTPTGETTPEITVKYADFYNVVVTRENGCKRQNGFEVIELCPPTFFIPNAFTPDDDGINDIYKVPVSNYETFTLRIFDRFGRILFRSDDTASGWDGTYNGRKCPVGVYTYKININGFTVEGEKDRQRYFGTLTLYR